MLLGIHSYTTNFNIALFSHHSCPSKYTAQKLKFSIKDFFSKCDQILSFLWIWPHSLNGNLLNLLNGKLHFLCCDFFKTFTTNDRKVILNRWTLSAPAPQNGQTNCLSEFDHFVGLALKELKPPKKYKIIHFMINYCFLAAKSKFGTEIISIVNTHQFHSSTINTFPRYVQT